ncbi:hypothetical protein FH972_024241 [Carpinus fangiana]|uniref:Cytochrome P450 n=1 Tax=Carpinus fangiana TaxID=176857 RepID=A0A5N6KXG7_9ROSI|nr:hypothetical protein FH972_024241 [Carpinus fangiana]
MDSTRSADTVTVSTLQSLGRYWPLVLSSLITLVTSWLFSQAIARSRALAKFPIANKVPGFWSASKSKAKFRAQGNALIEAAEKKEFFAGYPGFDGFIEGTGKNRFLHDAVRTKLTQNLVDKLHWYVFRPAFQDCTDPRNIAWHTLGLRQTVLDIVARLSVLVNHTVNAAVAAKVLRTWPVVLRPLVHWFLPECKQLRAEVARARKILDPIIAKRRLGTGNNDDYNDAMQWMEEIAKGRPYNALSAQLALGFAATHTTSDLLSQALMDLCEHPEIIPALREEISEVLSTYGWDKTSLYRMKLLDSCLKETQRVKPVASNGVVLPRDVPIAISASRLRDSDLYENPDVWDGARFLKLRQTPGNENNGQLVSTSPEHYAFGHGKHACPGRFFAANEVKIALAHIIMKYDFGLANNHKPRTMSHGFEIIADPTVAIRIRRRTEVVDF